MYTPAVDVAGFDIAGLRDELVYEFGPDHEYVVIEPGPPVKLKVPFVQTGVVALAVAIGAVLITTETVFAVPLHPLLSVTVSLYTPAAVVVGLVMLGF